MKKTLLAVVLLSLAAVSAHAAADTTFDSAVRAPEPAQLVTTVKSTATVSTISISNSAATSVIVDTTQKYRWVEVQNKSGSCSIFCGDNSAVLSTDVNGSTGAGYEIAQSSTGVVLPAKRFEIPPGANFYCKSACAAASKATIIRGR